MGLDAGRKRQRVKNHGGHGSHGFKGAVCPSGLRHGWDLPAWPLSVPSAPSVVFRQKP